MKKAFTSIISMGLLILGITVLCVSFGGGVSAEAAGSKTGVGLAQHALKAFNSNWKYSYGTYGQISGGSRISDCAGLIKSYLWWTNDQSNPSAGSVSVGGGASSMLNSASVKGSINYSNSSSLPRIHGLILYQPGHVGVYVGNNMAIDNRDVGYNVKYEKVFGRARNKWTMWFKLPQISYPTTGFATYNGQTFYYENGQYVVNTSRTIGSKTYSFGANGVVSSSVPSAATVAAQKAAAATKKVAAAKVKVTTGTTSQKTTVQVKTASQSAVSSVNARQAELLSSSKAVQLQKDEMITSTSEPLITLTDEEIPKAAAPALVKPVEQPAGKNSTFAFTFVILVSLISTLIVFKTKKYMPVKDMMFHRILNYPKKHL